jgi:hypothetical protein
MYIQFTSFLFGGTEVWHQGLALTRQVLYHLSHSVSPQLTSLRLQSEWKAKPGLGFGYLTPIPMLFVLTHKAALLFPESRIERMTRCSGVTYPVGGCWHFLRPGCSHTFPGVCRRRLVSLFLPKPTWREEYVFLCKFHLGTSVQLIIILAL